MVQIWSRNPQNERWRMGVLPRPLLLQRSRNVRGMGIIKNNYFAKMCSGSEEGSYFKAHRLLYPSTLVLKARRLLYHSTPGLRVPKKKKVGGSGGGISNCMEIHAARDFPPKNLLHFFRGNNAGRNFQGLQKMSSSRFTVARPPSRVLY